MQMACIYLLSSSCPPEQILPEQDRKPILTQLFFLTQNKFRAAAVHLPLLTAYSTNTVKDAYQKINHRTKCKYCAF